MLDPTREFAAAHPTDTQADAVAGGNAHSPPTDAGRYVFGQELARGGMGVVYLATDTVLNRPVAVKVLHGKYGPTSAAARRFADEARITAQLQHPAIPPVHDLGTLPDGRPFLAMKLIKGETLDAQLDARPHPADDRGHFVAVFEQVCQAVAYAHDHGVIHRDLKPHNVMVGKFGEVQVMDWGLAKLLSDRPGSDPTDPDETRGGTQMQGVRESDAEFTQAGSILGTPAFMPPEQAIGAVDQLDARSDVFGLGGLLCVILTGRPPFSGETAESTRQAAARGQVGETFARLDGCGADPALVALCKGCLAPEKGERPADGGVVAREVAGLRAAADERVRRAEGERAAAEARAGERRKRRRLTLAGVAVLAAAVLGGLSVVLVVQRKANDELAAKNRELADEQAKAQERFALAQKAIATFHTGVSEDLLLKSEQNKELRTRLLTEAGRFYADLEKLLVGDDDPKSRRLLAEGYFQLAEVTGQIGTKSDALSLHRKALAIRRDLAAVAGADVDTRLDVAHSLGAIGKLLLETGREEDAVQVFTEERDTAAALEAAAPTKAVRTALAQSYSHVGGALGDQAKDADAMTAHQKASDLFGRLVREYPDDTALKFESASSLFDVGWQLQASRRPLDGRATAEQALNTFRELVAANPSNTKFREALAREELVLSSVLRGDEGRPEAALMGVERARPLIEELANSFPAVVTFQRMLAGYHELSGLALSELGKPAEALAALETALAIRPPLGGSDKTDFMLADRLAFTRISYGRLLARAGKPGAALREYEAAEAVFRKLAAEHFDLHTEYVQIWLALTLEHKALLLASQGKTAEAVAACREAVDIRQKRIDARSVMWYVSEQTVSYLRLGLVQRRAGQLVDAVSSFRRAIAMTEKLPQLTPLHHFTLACGHAQLAALAADPASGVKASEAETETAKAMAELRRAVDDGYTCLTTLRTDPALEPLRSRDDFQKIVKEVEAKAAKALETVHPPTK